MGQFPLYVKATIDKILFDEANKYGYEFFDMDGSYMNADKAESSNPAIIWSMLSFVENLRDPFWHLQFEVSARTSNDESQYDSLKISSITQELFAATKSFYIRDYSGAVNPTQNLGEIIVISAGLSPAAFDRISGIRPTQVTASVQRFP